jgi:hypothetical protein
MLDPSQNQGDRERERRNMGIGLTIVMSKDVSLRKRIIDKRGITTKEGY